MRRGGAGTSIRSLVSPYPVSADFLHRRNIPQADVDRFFVDRPARAIDHVRDSFRVRAAVAPWGNGALVTTRGRETLSMAQAPEERWPRMPQ